jgi:hypothetical protein
MSVDLCAAASVEDRTISARPDCRLEVGRLAMATELR